MAETTIEWTHRAGTIGAVWNIVTGCNKVDRGCKHCYAEQMHRRLQHMQPAKYNQPFLDGAVMHPDLLGRPFTWKKPRTIFVNSMSDLFHPLVDFGFVEQAFRVMERTPQHTYLILTKRPERAVEFWQYMNRPNEHSLWLLCPHNVWMGTSVNDQDSANKRIPALLRLPNVLRYISYEPATGPVDFTHIGGADHWVNALTGNWHEAPGKVLFRDMPRLHWVINGGESGRKAAPMHPDWARAVRDACALHGVPYFFKQWGAWEPVTYLNDASHEPVIKPGHTGKNFLFTHPYRTQNMIKTKSKTGNVLDGQIIQQYPIV